MKPALPGRGQIVASFNECINRGDLQGLAALMSDDHVFSDKTGAAVVGKDASVAAWRSFFAAFPDYRNVFERVEAKDEVIAVVGRSHCAESLLSGAALWSARVKGGLVAEWRVHEDTPANRARLGLDPHAQ